MAWISNARHAAKHVVENMKETEAAKLLDRLTGSVTGAFAASAVLGVVTGLSLSKPSHADTGSDAPPTNPPAEVPVPLPTDKLACQRSSAPPRTPTILVSCGSFNPPTVAHMRMFEVATQALAERGHDVWGCYMSPVNDAYNKQHLAPVRHRLAMCKLAADATPNVMLDPWESQQPGYIRTLTVLQRIESQLQHWLHPNTSTSTTGTAEPPPAATTAPATPPPATAPLQQHSTAAHTEDADEEDDVSAVLSTVFMPGAVAPTCDGHCNNPRHHHRTITITKPHHNPSEDVAAVLSIAFMPGTEPLSIPSPSETTPPPPPHKHESSKAGSKCDRPQVMLLCGEDLLETMSRPGAWHRPDYILEHYGVVCVARDGGRVAQLLQQPGSLLHSYRERIVMVQDPVPNTISATKVRSELQAGRPVRWLVPEPVLQYVYQHGLYGSKPEPPQSL